MKALKEKRVSLRSLFRRSLVILSLLALVFASCGDSGSSNGNGNGPGTEPPVEPPVEPPAKVVSAIVILQQPQVESYQGMKPQLDGLIADVIFTDGSKLTWEEYNPASPQFYAIPNYADKPSYEWDFDAEAEDETSVEAWVNGDTPNSIPYAPQLFQIGFTGSSGVSTGLMIPLVIPATNIEVDDNGPKILYSDERTLYGDWKYWMTYGQKGTGKYTTLADWQAYRRQVDSLNPGEDTIGLEDRGKSGGFTRKSNTVNAVYPFVSFEDTVDSLRMNIYVDGEKNKLYPGTVNTQIKTPIGNTSLATTWKLDDFYRVDGVTVASADWGDGYFDDDFGKFYNFNASVNEDEGIGFQRYTGSQSKTLAEFQKKNLKFAVTYRDKDRNPVPGEPKIITMAQFMANNAWYQDAGLTGTNYGYYNSSYDNITQFPDPVWDRTGTVSILTFNEESGAQFKLLYAPPNWNSDVWTSNVDVDVPVGEFIMIELEQRGGGGSRAPIQLKIGQTSAYLGRGNLSSREWEGSIGRAMTNDEINAINYRWQLRASYTNGSKVMSLTKDMFHAGASQVFNRNAGGPPGGQNTFVPFGNYEDGVFYLPIWYRGELITSDEGVPVEAIK